MLSSFYYMDIGDFKYKLKDKTWVTGHVHSRHYIKSYECQFANASLGYPIEGRLDRKQIVTIDTKIR
jgi:hypothetical protein